MNWERTLVGLLVIGILAIGLLLVASADQVNGEQIDENIDWVTLGYVSFDSPKDVVWEGSASIASDGEGSYLSCEGPTKIFQDGAWTDVRVELRLRLGSGGLGISVRGGESGRIEFGILQDRYVLIRHPGVCLQDVMYSSQLDEDRWYSIVFIALGDRFVVEVDGETLFVIQDNEPLLAPGSVLVFANPMGEPICLDDIRISCPREDVSIDKLFPSISDWTLAFEEVIEEGWDSSLLTSQLDTSTWELVVDDERTALQVDCNCWIELPGSYSWQDYAFTTSVKVDHGGATLSFRTCSEGRYFAELQDGKLLLGKEQPWGNRTTLATASCPIELGTWYKVTIAGNGPDLFVFLDGQLQIHHADESSPILAGGVSYETCGEDPVLLIDNIEILAKEGLKDPQALLDTGYALLDEDDGEAAYEAFAEADELFHAEGNKSGEAEALRSMGKALICSGDVSAAIDSFQQAANILTEIGDRASLAWCYLDIGNAHMQLHSLPRAEEYFKLARDSFVALSDREGEIEALRSEGHFLLALAEGFRQVGNRAQAIVSITSALRAFRDAGDKKEEANALMTLAWVYWETYRFADGVDCCEKAEPLFRSIGDHRGLRWTLAVRLFCYSSAGQFDLAQEVGEKALDVYRSEKGDRGVEAGILADLSRAYWGQGKLQRAIDYSLMAISMYRELGNMAELPENLERLANFYSQVGEMDLAAEYHQQSIDLALNLDGLVLADGFRMEGLSYRDRGDLPAAIVSMGKALAMYRQLGDHGGEALCLTSLADFHMAAGLTDQAQKEAEQVVTIGQETGRSEIEFSGLGSLCRIHTQLGQIDRAIEFADQQLQIAHDSTDTIGQIGVYRSLAHLLVESDRLEEGIKSLQTGLQVAQNVGAIGTQADLHQELAELYQTIGQLEEAREHYKLAIAVVEHTFGGLEMEALQSSFFVRVKEVYEEYLHLLLQMRQKEDTLSVAERCRARTFLDLVAENAGEVLKNVPEEGIRTGVVAPEAIDSDMHEVVKSLPRNTAALEYFVTNDVTYVWGISEGAAEGPIVIPRGREQLMKKVIECRQRLEGTDVMVNRDLAELYDWLIRPVESWLPKAVDGDTSVPHLIIIPSGPLYYLPFQALLGTSTDRSDQFRLIDRYAVSYSPSLVTLKYATAREGETSATSTFLGLADPDPGDPTLRLPEAQDEVNHVAALFTNAQVYAGKDATESVLQQEAQHASYVLIAAHGKFNPQHPMYSYLLLSPTQKSDGRLNTYEVFGLGMHAKMVVLSACETLLPAMEEMKEEERLTRGLAKGATVELTEGQLEQLTRGDEVAGLTRAFIAAGAASVVSSLWSVPSEATTALMVSLYTHLEEGMSKAGALRAAQLEVMNTTGWTQPWYWAAFDLMGDWR